MLPENGGCSRSVEAEAKSPAGMEIEDKWQSTKQNLLSRAAYALERGILCDVDFIVGGGDSHGDDAEGTTECISAHRLILSLSSSVFFAMFNGPIVTGDRVVVPDVQPPAFRALLKYIYAVEVELDASTVMSTLYAAKKYEVPGLESACEEFLLKSVCSENAVMLLSQAKFFDEKRLMEQCLECIDLDAGLAFKQDAFADIKLDLLCSLLERDTLNIEEIDVYDAVRRWAAAECKRRKLPPSDANQRSVVGEAISLIRFPVMRGAVFAAGPAKSAFLTDQEKLDVLSHIVSDPKPHTTFPCEPRIGSGECLKLFSEVVPYGAAPDSRIDARMYIHVQSKPVVLTGVGIYGATSASPCSYSGTVSLCVWKGSTLYSKDVSFTSVGSTSSSPFIYRHVFDKPVAIQVGSWYDLSCSFSGPDFFVGSDNGKNAFGKRMKSGGVISFANCTHMNGGSSRDKPFQRMAIIYLDKA